MVGFVKKKNQCLIYGWTKSCRAMAALPLQELYLPSHKGYKVIPKLDLLLNDYSFI